MRSVHVDFTGNKRGPASIHGRVHAISPVHGTTEAYAQTGERETEIAARPSHDADSQARFFVVEGPW